MRLIDADALKTKIIKFCGCVPYVEGELGSHDVLYLDEAIDNAPTIEPRRGEWVKMVDAYGLIEGFIHTDCGRSSQEASSFCPNCGAKMESEGST